MIWREINRKMILKRKKKEKGMQKAGQIPQPFAVDVHLFSWLKPQGNM